MGEMTIFLDIETIPTQCAETRKAIAGAVKPPASMKKQETIDAWWRENGDQAIADAIAKTSFDPARGHICTIAWAVGPEEVRSFQIERAEDEATALQGFFDQVDTFHRVEWVGHYISGFDLRFILCRAVVLGVKIPQCIPRDPKPWGGQVFDTMTAWAGTRDTISMDNLCAALGLPGKDGMSGADVAGAFDSGEFAQIEAYCREDVERTRAIWRKFQAAGW